MEYAGAATPPVALVVGAGGPTGGPYIWSALQAIHERTGWSPEMASAVVGTSAGAFVAARIGLQKTPSALATEQLLLLENGRLFRPGKRTMLAAGLRGVAARVVAAVAPLSRPAAEYTVPQGPYHEAAMAVTVQRRSGVRHQHDLNDATDSTAVVRASAAIPGLNKPVEVDGVYHVDGAVNSANNVDLLDPEEHPVVLVISPMIPASGGSLVSRSHRAQLRRELKPWMEPGRAAIVVMPSAEAHRERRDRERYEPEGAKSVARLGK